MATIHVHAALIIDGCGNCKDGIPRCPLSLIPEILAGEAEGVQHNRCVD